MRHAFVCALVSCVLATATACPEDPVIVDNGDGDESGDDDGGGDGGGGDGNAFVVVENYSSVVVWSIFVARCSATTWGEDRLGGYVLSPDQRFTQPVPPGCWDIRAEDQSGRGVEHRNELLSAGETFTWPLVNAKPDDAPDQELADGMAAE